MKERIKRWWFLKSETFTKLAGEGDTFTHGDVVLAHLGLLAFLLLLCIVGGIGNILEEGGPVW